MKPAHSLARLNGRILNAYSRRTAAALRAALPLRLALPHLEPVLALNVDKEVQKDRLVILRARELMQAGPLAWSEILPQLLPATKEIDRAFLSRVGGFPVDIVIRYEEIAPIRALRLKLLYDAALKILSARDRDLRLRGAMQASFSRDELGQLLGQLFRLYAEEVRSLSRSVRLPALLVPLRELIAQELLDVMLRVARPLALEIAATVFHKAAGGPPPAPLRNPEGSAD
ncbi:MAG: hypothetical protein IPH41_03610 [Sulfuritalea sp.]|nr:hypothetical protein [Sulfuritalea sp.]MBP8897086.1 hypothetical protein [Sulfuritalea sp.]